ncbi:nuclear RNA export factor 1-like [Ptychodera flava]|uniref:nuclear RNA export factor 1-like n=1 Tax=Ptychodera flava TaxID=63121 RepID=UPI003969CA7F
MSSHHSKDFKVTTSRSGIRSFGQHDDRSSPPSWRGRRDRSRRGRGNRGRRGRNNAPHPRSRLEDDDGDIAMDDPTTSGGGSRFAPYGPRPQSRRANHPESRGGRMEAHMDRESRGGAMSRLGLPLDPGVKGRRNEREKNMGRDSPDMTWAKITIPYGRKYDKDWLIRSIQNLCQEPFQIHDFHYFDHNASFYVEDKRTGEAIRSLTRKITPKDGRKIVILMKPGIPRNVPDLDQNKLEILKTVMSKRYDVPTQALNLSNIYRDEDLQSQGVKLLIHKPNIMNAILKIIEENIPQMQSLDLSENRLTLLENLQNLPNKAPHLKKLSLGRNSLRYEKELEKIKRLKIEELILDGNPLCDNFSDQSSYIRAVRKYFPKILKLDGHDLPPVIGFALDESDTALPETKGSFFINDHLKTLILTFLEQYYACYDSDDRQKLLEAYHEKACFSLTIPPPPKDGHQSKIQSLYKYTQYNRSINKIHEPERTFRLLKQSRLNVVACLAELPETQHDLASFVVDVSMFTGTFLNFSVSGIFKETSSHNPPIRSFTRTFLAVPAGSGLCIINDQLSVGRPTQSQLKGAFTTPAPTPSTSPVPPEVQTATPPQVQPVPVVAQPVPSTSKSQPAEPALTAQQQQMIQTFSQQSGMNLEWSYKCLSENNWNYENSAKIFTDLQAKGSIPPQAFAK